MTNPVISVEHLSKAYRIGTREEIPDTLAGAAVGLLKAPWRNWRRLRRLDVSEARGQRAEGSNGNHSDSQLSTLNSQPASDILWALRDVSFEVQEGEVVGIIGRNGAGKSTLLKILSRITEPTSGRAVIRGRVSSLLEVGTGFHPELTGRENIYMNGTILGMTRREIDRKFDEIVDFSGVEQFLDTAVKRYSSGMTVRLAFAVAAHLEPEILIVDEVLTVGDTEFQRKCLGKMQHVAAHGRTVLFVSHNMPAVQALCTRGVLLRDGHKSVDASASETVDHYLRTVEKNACVDTASRKDRRGTGHVRLVRATVLASETSPEGALVTGYPAHFIFEASRPLRGLQCTFTIYDQRGHAVTSFDTRLRSVDDQVVSSSQATFKCTTDALPLRPGRYRLNAALHVGATVLDHVEGVTVFTVEGGSYRGRLGSPHDRLGAVWIPHHWTLPDTCSA